MTRTERDRSAALALSEANQAKAKLANDAFRVEVVEDATGAVVKTIGCVTQRQAERVEGGLSINLNHERYSTRITTGDAE